MLLLLNGEIMKNLSKTLVILSNIAFTLAVLVPVADILINDTFKLILNASEFEYLNYGMLIGSIINLLMNIFIFVSVGFVLRAISEILDNTK